MISGKNPCCSLQQFNGYCKDDMCLSFERLKKLWCQHGDKRAWCGERDLLSKGRKVRARVCKGLSLCLHFVLLCGWPRGAAQSVWGGQSCLKFPLFPCTESNKSVTLMVPCTVTVWKWWCIMLTWLKCRRWGIKCQLKFPIFSLSSVQQLWYCTVLYSNGSVFSLKLILRAVSQR